MIPIHMCVIQILNKIPLKYAASRIYSTRKVNTCKEITDRWEYFNESKSQIYCRRSFCMKCGKSTCEEDCDGCVYNMVSEKCDECFKDITNH